MKRGLLLALALAALFAWWWSRQPETGLSAGADAPMPGAAHAVDAGPARAEAPDPPTAPTPAAFAPGSAYPDLAKLEAALPALTTQLAEASESWWAAARAGSGEAAWRLVEAHATCAQREDAIEWLLERRPHERPGDDRLAWVEEFLVLAEDFCEGSDADHRAARREALMLGVEAGDVRALAEYLRSPPIPSSNAIALADELLRYREQAPRIAAWLLEQGYADLPWMLAVAHDGLSEVQIGYFPRVASLRLLPDAPAGPPRERTQLALGQVLADDPALAWRHARLCMRVGTDWMRKQCEVIARANARLLSDEERERQQAWGETWKPREQDRWLPDQHGYSEFAP